MPFNRVEARHAYRYPFELSRLIALEPFQVGQAFLFTSDIDTPIIVPSRLLASQRCYIPKRIVTYEISADAMNPRFLLEIGVLFLGLPGDIVVILLFQEQRIYIITQGDQVEIPGILLTAQGG